jgi:glycosyltransferase involved in cell wall biosynthesis
MNVLHVITGLNVGGAETMLAKLLETQGGAFGRATVVSLAEPGVIAPRIRACARLETIGMREGVPSLLAAYRLARLTRMINPDLVIGWMHHGNLAASFAAATMRHVPPVIWNVRHSVADIASEKPLTRLVLRLGAMLSGTPDAIVYNSAVAAAQYRGLGYDPSHTLVIPNGFDCDRYRPRADARESVRRQLRVHPEATLVGMIARLHPMKDPFTLIEAVRRAKGVGADIHLLLAGQGMDRPPPELIRALEAALPPERLTLLGQCNDLPELMPGLDVLALPSAWGEGFPNTIAEAMASGVPCLATDVGDSGWIVGQTGRVVAPRDAEGMAAALLDLVSLGEEGRRQLGLAARQRVIDNFALSEIGARFSTLYHYVVRHCRDAQPNEPHRPFPILYGGARP